MRREFTVVPPDLRWALIPMMLGAAVAIVGIAIAARQEPGLWLMLVPIALVPGSTAWVLRRRRVVLDGDLLQISGGINGTRVRVGDLDADAGRIVDLGEATTLRPMLRIFGTAMPSFRAGHFRLRDRSRAFLLLTATTKVLVLRERSGRLLLLSLERPQALLDALREATAGNARQR